MFWPACPGPLPDGLWDEVFLILEASGHIVPDAQLRPWHGAVLLDDTGQRAIALRLRLAQRNLGLTAARFYEPIFPTPSLYAFSESDLLKLSAYHGIPEEWVISGEPSEIELPESE